MKRDKLPNHLSFVRLLPCLICGHPGVEAAHIRYTDRRAGKTNPGIGRKPDDRWAVPLCSAHHREQHEHGDERAWWKYKNRNPIFIALALWGVTGNCELGEMIVKEAREVC